MQCHRLIVLLIASFFYESVCLGEEEKKNLPQAEACFTFEKTFQRYESPAVAFSPDSRFLVFGGPPKELRIWDLTAKKMQIEIPWKRGEDEPYRMASLLAWTPDGKNIVEGGGGQVHVWD